MRRKAERTISPFLVVSTVDRRILTEIMENQKTVNTIVGQLRNPPEEYKSAYKALAECYDTYLIFTNLAVYPTGSLNSFSEDFDAADTEFIHCYHLMEFYLQD